MDSQVVSGEPALKVRSLRRSFAGVRAVDGLDFDVQPGSITGMIGPNGCGKTTSINCITGFDQRYTGEVRVDGRSVVKLAPDVIAKVGVMRTFQAVRVFDTFTVMQNAKMGMQCFDGLRCWEPVLRNRRFKQVEDETAERAERLLSSVGLTAKMNDLAGSLSYGQKKLLALACTLMSRPRVVILDEPVAGVNPTLVNEIAEIISELNRQGITFLIVEHNIDFIMRLSHVVVVMDRGRCLTTGAPEEVRKDSRVLEAYLGDGDGA